MEVYRNDPRFVVELNICKQPHILYYLLRQSKARKRLQNYWTVLDFPPTLA